MQGENYSLWIFFLYKSVNKIKWQLLVRKSQIIFDPHDTTLESFKKHFPITPLCDHSTAFPCLSLSLLGQSDVRLQMMHRAGTEQARWSKYRGEFSLSQLGQGDWVKTACQRNSLWMMRSGLLSCAASAGSRAHSVGHQHYPTCFTGGCMLCWVTGLPPMCTTPLWVYSKHVDLSWLVCWTAVTSWCKHKRILWWK